MKKVALFQSSEKHSEERNRATFFICGTISEIYCPKHFDRNTRAGRFRSIPDISIPIPILGFFSIPIPGFEKSRFRYRFRFPKLNFFDSDSARFRFQHKERKNIALRANHWFLSAPWCRCTDFLPCM